MFKKTLFILIATIFILSACASAVTSPDANVVEPTEVVMEKPTEDVQENVSDLPADTTEEPAAPPANTPNWFALPLTNVQTGESFTLNDFNGKVVLVENLAMWCSNCKKQQIQVRALHELLGERTDFVSLGLDIDTNENAADLKNYIDNNGFDWNYAVASAEIAREISSLYGAQFLNPPSTPILIIDRLGQVHPMPFGIKSANDLYSFIEPFLLEDM
ncbi:MAG: redoxin domain-containing protein [Anaerolineaceae bacterium]|nr:redoxin domain-containing protein [Anaerolineaceae bacterium]